MALSDEKLITLNNITELIKHLERSIPVYTMAEYNTKKSSIPKGTFFVISDDAPQMSSMQAAQITEDDLDLLISSGDDATTSSDPELDGMFSD